MSLHSYFSPAGRQRILDIIWQLWNKVGVSPILLSLPPSLVVSLYLFLSLREVSALLLLSCGQAAYPGDHLATLEQG